MDLLCFVFFCLVFVMPLCASVCALERPDFLALLCGV